MGGLRTRMSHRRRSGVVVGLTMVVLLGLSLPVPASTAGAQVRTAAASTAEPGLTAANINRLRPEWSADQGYYVGTVPVGITGAAPVVADGLVVFYCHSEGICAESGGSMVWSNPAFDLGSGDPHNPITVSDGVGYAFAGSDAQAIGAFNVKTGATLWVTPVSTYELISEITVRGGLAYVGDIEGNLLAFKVKTGELAWSVPLDPGDPAPAPAGVTPVAAGNVVYDTNQHGAVTAYDAKTGATLWSGYEAMSGSGALVLHNGSVYLLGESFEEGYPNVAVFSAAGCGASTCSPTSTIAIDADIFNDYVSYLLFVGEYAVTNVVGNLVVLNSSTFDPIWSNISPSGASKTTGEAVVSQDLVIVPNGDSTDAYRLGGCGASYCKPVWSRQLDYTGSLAGPAAVSGTSMYVASPDALYGFGFGTTAFDPPGAPAPVVALASTAGQDVDYSFDFDTPDVAPGNYPIIGWQIESTDGKFQLTEANLKGEQSGDIDVPAGRAVSFVVKAVTLRGVGHPSPPSSPIVEEVPAADGISAKTSSTITFTLPSGISKGATVVAAIGAGNGQTTATVSSITGGGVTWTRAAGTSSGTGDEEMWYGLASVGISGEAHIIVTMTRAVTQLGGVIWPLVNVAAATPVDTSGAVAGGGRTVSMPSMTTATNGDMIAIGVRLRSTFTSCSGNLYSEVFALQPHGHHLKYDANGLFWEPGAPAGTYTASCTQKAAGPWATAGIAFTPAKTS